MRRSYVVLDDANVDTGVCTSSTRRALKPKFYQPTQTMVTAGNLPFRENSQGRAGNRTRDLMISSQTLTTRPRGWPRKESSGRDKTRGFCQTLWLRQCTLIEPRNINQSYDYAEAGSKNSCTDPEREADCTYMKFILQFAQYV